MFRLSGALKRPILHAGLLLPRSCCSDFDGSCEHFTLFAFIILSPIKHKCCFFRTSTVTHGADTRSAAQCGCRSLHVHCRQSEVFNWVFFVVFLIKYRLLNKELKSHIPCTVKHWSKICPKENQHMIRLFSNSFLIFCSFCVVMATRASMIPWPTTVSMRCYVGLCINVLIHVQ